ncbi:PD-(D/E)XK nuclease-like domain-containing protein [Nesterenkonia suensis]
MKEPGLYPDVPPHEYHVNDGSLSSTMAKMILRSPAHLRTYLDGDRKTTPAMEFGTAVHSMVLEAGEGVVLVHADSWRTKAAKAEKDAIEAEGMVPLLAADYTRAEDIARAVHAHPVAGPLLRGADTEVSAYGRHGSGVTLRGRFDAVKSGVLIDLKTAMSADPREFHRTAASLGYHIQAAHYSVLYELATGNRPSDFLFILAEKERPHAVSVVRLEPAFMDIGRARVEEAVQLYHRAQQTGEWPAYPSHIHDIEPPMWLMSQDEEEFELTL